MYPDWPRSAAELVPLPHCDGPKLKAFDFKGPQKIAFLEHIAFASYLLPLARVYPLSIGQFRSVCAEDWLGPDRRTKDEDLKAMNAFNGYADPFNSECRAFGRLQETGHEELAIRCYGYVLLDEDHERTLMERFARVDFRGNGDCPGQYDVRPLFPGRDGRPPPLRAVVKELGPTDEPLQTKSAQRILRDMIGLQQLGIINIDVAHRQIVGGKISDFSQAITTPHFITTPELNPSLAGTEWITALEFETFQFSICDFWEFDDMVFCWNDDHEGDPRNPVPTYAFPGGFGGLIPYNLRSTPSRARVYSLVNPRFLTTTRLIITMDALDVTILRQVLSQEKRRVQCLAKPGRNSIHKEWPKIELGTVEMWDEFNLATLNESYGHVLDAPSEHHNGPAPKPTRLACASRLKVDHVISLDESYPEQHLAIGLSRTERDVERQEVRGTAVDAARQFKGGAALAEARTRYGYLQTEEEIVVCCFSKADPPAKERWKAAIMPVPWSRHGTEMLTTDLALWWLCILSMSGQREILAAGDTVKINQWDDVYLDEHRGFGRRHRYSNRKDPPPLDPFAAFVDHNALDMDEFWVLPGQAQG
ncbi:hypothetical protein N0V88_000503 [Collariella sp. IMI 366227]|nr:hypothetical protein N0V88_000503 [Collariella sp. IMI 366227]